MIEWIVDSLIDALGQKTEFETENEKLQNCHMKPIFRFVSLVMALLFLTGAAFAWTNLLGHENLLADPLLKTASGFLMTGLMFLALGLRGWRPRKRQGTNTTRTEPPKPLR